VAKGPRLLGRLTLNISKDFIATLGAEVRRTSKLKKREEKKGKEAQFATEQAQALREQMVLAAFVRNPIESTGKGRTEREEMA
jgi:hypothetical protein